MTLINIAEICPTTQTLGPGKRFALWVQGCCFSCEGCVSPNWIPQKSATLIEVDQLVNAIVQIPNLDGVTISGGEPMLQAQQLSELFAKLRAHLDLSIMCFTGFTLPQLLAKNDPDIAFALSFIDVLVDGLYVASQNDNRGWRGSSNQVVHFLTERHLHEADLFTDRKRDVEVYLRDNDALMVGVPPKGFSQSFESIISTDINPVGN